MSEGAAGWAELGIGMAAGGFGGTARAGGSSGRVFGSAARQRATAAWVQQGREARIYRVAMELGEIEIAPWSTSRLTALNGQIAAMAGRGGMRRMELTDEIADHLSHGVCFVAGTPIAVVGGATKPIETIQPGDLVLSKDEQTGAEGYKPVARTFVTHPEVLVHVTFEGVDGVTAPTYRASSEVVGTPEHPIWRLDTGWVPMGTLAVGDVVRCSDGRTARVGKSWSERAPEGQAFITYSFEVADWHTYFVQAGEGAVWVHNTCPGGSVGRYDKVGGHACAWESGFPWACYI